jgi:hypothetical protein
MPTTGVFKRLFASEPCNFASPKPKTPPPAVASH